MVSSSALCAPPATRPARAGCITPLTGVATAFAIVLISPGNVIPGRLTHQVCTVVWMLPDVFFALHVLCHALGRLPPFHGTAGCQVAVNGTAGIDRRRKICDNAC